MRNRKLILCLLMVVVLSFTAGTAFSSIHGLFSGYPIVRVTVNGNEVKGDVPGVMLKGRTMVPVRFILDALRANVTWDEATYTVSITTEEKVAQLPTPTPTPTPTPEPTPTTPTPPQPTLTSASELKDYLQGNFGKLETCIGTAQFTFSILENNFTFFPYDYWIQVKYPYEFFSGAMYNTAYTQEQKTLLRSQLKEHQEKIAVAAIKSMPNKKLYGGYFDSWYRYPSIKVDLITRYYFTWANYEDPGISVSDKYGATKPATFRWLPKYDNEL